MNELLVVLPLPVLVLIGIAIAISVFVIIYAYFKDKKLEEVRVDVYRLFLKAEHMVKESKAGKQKMKWVLSRARLLLPKWLQLLISEDTFERIIQLWFDEIKDLLDDGKLNHSGGR